MRLLVSYKSDPGWHHERVVLWMISKTRFVVLTPDGDMYDERLRDYATVMIMTGRLNYPDGVINVVAFEAALENADLADYITQGRLEAERIVKAEGLVSPPLPVSHIDWGGDDIVLAPPSVRARARHRIWGKTAVKKLPPVADSPSKGPARHHLPDKDADTDEGDALEDLDLLEPGDGMSWVVCDPLHGEFGSVCMLGPGSLILDDCAIAKVPGGKNVAVKRTPTGSVEGFGADSLARLQKITDKVPKLGDVAPKPEASEERTELQDLRTRIGAARPSTDGPGGGAGAPAPKVADGNIGEDVRTLRVTCDEQGDRYKDWRTFCREIYFSNFNDGYEKHREVPNCSLDLFRNWSRYNFDPMQWLKDFLREYAIGPKERTAIESRMPVKAIWLSGPYDHLNGPSLACIEELSRRAAQLVEAYDSGHSGRPNWTGVKHFTATYHSGSVVPTQFWTYAHRKTKEEVEIENLRIRAGNAMPALQADAEGLATSPPPATPKAKAKAKAKGAARRLSPGAGGADA